MTWQGLSVLRRTVLSLSSLSPQVHKNPRQHNPPFHSSTRGLPVSLTFIGKAMLLSMGVYSDTKYRFLKSESTEVVSGDFNTRRSSDIPAESFLLYPMVLFPLSSQRARIACTCLPQDIDQLQ